MGHGADGEDERVGHVVDREEQRVDHDDEDESVGHEVDGEEQRGGHDGHRKEREKCKARDPMGCKPEKLLGACASQNRKGGRKEEVKSHQQRPVGEC